MFYFVLFFTGYSTSFKYLNPEVLSKLKISMYSELT